MNAPILGVVETKTDAALPGYTIHKVIVGYAYATNKDPEKGGNGTPKVQWVTRCDGKRVGTSTTIKAAKELAALHAEVG